MAQSEDRKKTRQLRLSREREENMLEMLEILSWQKFFKKIVIQIKNSSWYTYFLPAQLLRMSSRLEKIILYVFSPLRWHGELPSGGRHSTDSRRHSPKNRKQDLWRRWQRGVWQDRLQTPQTGAGRLWAFTVICCSTQRVAWHLLNRSSLSLSVHPWLHQKERRSCANCALLHDFGWEWLFKHSSSLVCAQSAPWEYEWWICGTWRFTVSPCWSVLQHHISLRIYFIHSSLYRSQIVRQIL